MDDEDYEDDRPAKIAKAWQEFAANLRMSLRSRLDDVIRTQPVEDVSDFIDASRAACDMEYWALLMESRAHLELGRSSPPD